MKFGLPRLYPILDTPALQSRGFLDWPAAARAMIAGGAEILQLRHKDAWTRLALAQAEEIAADCRRASVAFFVNDRADIAKMLGAGVHVGQTDMTPADVRTVLGDEPAVGFSTHNQRQLEDAENEPVDYLAFGPVFATRSKEDSDPVAGLELLARARSRTLKPLVAIGGIARETAAAVLATGVDSIALIGALLPDTLSETALRNRMEEWQHLTRK